MLLTDRGQPYLRNVRLKARAVTLNNLGCLMKKWGKPRVAIKYLARALRIEAAIPGGGDNPAGTHLNMSAALSAVGMHCEAASHAIRAIDLAAAATAATATVIPANSRSSEANATPAGDNSERNGVLQGPESNEISSRSEGSLDARSTAATRGGLGDEEDSSQNRINAWPYNEEHNSQHEGRSEHDDHSACDGARTTLDADTTRDAAAGNNAASDGDDGSADDTERTQMEVQRTREAGGGLLAIAYFNLAVEQEHLGNIDAALNAYEDAHEAADAYLGPESPVVRGIESAIESASEARASALSANRRRREIRSAGVSSLPCIGKLRLSPRTVSPRKMRSSSGLRPAYGYLDHTSPRQSVTTPSVHSDNGMMSAGKRGLVCTPRDCAIVRAYTSPRPSDPMPPVCRSFKPTSPASSPRTSTLTRHQPSRLGSGFGKEQRRNSESFCDSDAMLWRAQACAAFGCSPREALYAQQAEKRELEAGGDVLIGEHHGEEVRR